MSDDVSIGENAPTRGGRKLAAAIERFSLAKVAAGASVIDVGASTGGFTEVWLRAGAARVTAIDVGRDQLAARLRADPRVHSMEGTNFRTLALGAAPGPFDAFSVDVSFASARSQLRALAFRLRPGAQGVVLVKPQFELPAHRIRHGDVSDLRLRTEAVARVREKAGSLGFRLLETIDSPVAGGSGTVEILAHLVFDGRSARLPQPGERRAAPNRAPAAPPDARGEEENALARNANRASRGVAGGGVIARGSVERVQAFAIALPGLEAVVTREVAALPGVEDVRAVPGGTEWSGPPSLVLHANLRLRVASRILVRIGTVEAREFSQLRRGVARLDVERFVAAADAIRVGASATRCRLRHTGALEETVALGIADRLRRVARSARASVAAAAAADGASRLFVRGENDRFTVSVDASGDLLHRRGWRSETSGAPLRETVAAGILALAAYDPSRPLVDPFCGAGTIAIEAARIATGRAAGLDRPFACEHWPSSDPVASRALRARLAEEVLAAAPAPIVASDADERAAERTRRNAERAGVASSVSVTCRAISELRAPRGAGRGLLVANPPWGHRLGTFASARDLHHRLGSILRERFARWRVAILVGDPRLVDALRLAPVSAHHIRSGGIRARLLIVEL